MEVLNHQIFLNHHLCLLLIGTNNSVLQLVKCKYRVMTKSYGSWIYNYLGNQYLSLLKL